MTTTNSFETLNSVFERLALNPSSTTKNAFPVSFEALNSAFEKLGLNTSLLVTSCGFERLPMKNLTAASTSVGTEIGFDMLVSKNPPSTCVGIKRKRCCYDDLKENVINESIPRHSENTYEEPISKNLRTCSSSIPNLAPRQRRRKVFKEENLLPSTITGHLSKKQQEDRVEELVLTLRAFQIYVSGLIIYAEVLTKYVLCNCQGTKITKK